MPFLIDQQAAFLDGDVVELERGERVADPPLGVAVLDDRVGGQLGGGGDLEVDLDQVGLGRDVALAGDGETLDIRRWPRREPAIWLEELSPGRADRAGEDQRRGK